MTTVESLLIDTARRGELHHSVILHGPDATALRELAIRLAKTLNCERGDGDDACTSCSKIARGIHPDVHLTSVADDRKMISVEQIRSIVEQAGLRPYEARTKVFIIESADAMSAAGANALLKTLEEPTEDTAFFLLTRSADRLLITIRSRSQAIAIRPAVAEARDDAGLEQRARAAARAAGIDEEFAAQLAEATESKLVEWANGDTTALLELGAIAGNVDDAAASMTLLASLLKDLAVSPAGERAPAVRERAGTAALLRAADTLLRGALRLNVNVDARLAIEQALVELTKK